MRSIRDTNLSLLDGTPLDWSRFSGRHLLIVNVASECGYTPQYAQLQELHDAAGDALDVLGVPCNDFGGQEPGSPDQIRDFCSTTYGVTFPLTEKVRITGDPHPLYAWLTREALNGVSDAEVDWNFNKFLIGPDGDWLARYPSAVTPFDEDILNRIGL